MVGLSGVTETLTAELNLDGWCRVTNISPLANLTNPEMLYVQCARVTAEEVAKLRKALPDCRILR